MGLKNTENVGKKKKKGSWCWVCGWLDKAEDAGGS